MMIKMRFLFCLLLFAFTVSSCSIAINQDSGATPSPRIGSVPSAAAPNVSSTKIPITWGSLNLAGRMVDISGKQPEPPAMRIQVLDLATGEVKAIFQAPVGAWIYFLTVSPARQVVMAYSPPFGDKLSGHQALYILPVDGSAAPKLLFTPGSNDDDYAQPAWSPDGKSIYFSHTNPELPTSVPHQQFPVYEVLRMAYPDGTLEKVADQAFWPRVSPDSARFVYVSVDAATGKNKLFVADADGSNSQQIVMSGPVIPDIIDAPVFSADGQSIMFSAVVSTRGSAPAWWETALGITTASAHTIPSEWWSVPVGGGIPTQLTRIHSISLFASVSPDKKHIVSYSGYGLFVMNPDGTASTMLVNDLGGIPDTGNLIP